MARLPETIGKYKIIERLGRGGMGLVYKAEHPTLGTTVVLKKLMLKGEKTYRERFRREATLMMQLRHENIVGIFDHFKEANAYYLVMEYIDGKVVSELQSSASPLSARGAAWIIKQTSLALSHIHSNGIVHRDLKPSNILVAKDGTVKLSDFGIAFSPDDSDILTAQGSALGTPSFMAPEQLIDAHKADERSDIWSLGVCFFELLTGNKFVTGPTPAAIHEAIPDATQNMAKMLPPGTPSSYRNFLKKCLCINPVARLGNGAEALQMMNGRDWGEVSIFQEPLIDEQKNMPPKQQVKRRIRKRNLSADTLLGIFNKAEPQQKQHRIKISQWLAQRFTLKFFLILMPIIFALCLLLLPGLWDNLARANRFGRMYLRLAIPEEAPDHWLNGVRAHLYKPENATLVELMDLPLRRSKDSSHLRSRVVSLPVGTYRLNWSLGERIVWRSFYLESIRASRKEGAYPIVLEEILGDPPVFIMKLEPKVLDAVTKEEIQAEITWSRLDRSGEKLESGGTYKFNIEAPHYRPTNLSIGTSPWRRELAIQVELWPLPGMLRIRNTSPRTQKIRIDGKRYILDLSNTPHLRKIQGLKPNEESSFSILPGNHRISPKRNNEGGADVSILPSKELQLNIKIDENNKALISPLASP